MKRIISFLRMYFKKYPFIFNILKSIHLFFIFLKNRRIVKEKIKTDLKKIECEKKNSKRKKCWLVCVPSHANLGDQAMALAERRWISENYPECNLIELSREFITSKKSDFIDNLKKTVSDDDIFFIQGGYTTGDKSANEPAHRLLAENFKNKIVFFPQTVFYSNDAEKKITADIYNKHGRILFLARDEISYNTIKDDFKNVIVKYYPDVVSSLIGRFDYNKSYSENGILFCIREDSEKKYSKKEITELTEAVSDKYDVCMSDLMMNKNGRSAEEFEKIITELVEKMSCYKLIVTDRFHGIIFGILSNTKVCAIDSVDFKVREGAKTFSKLFPGSVYYASALSDVKKFTDNEYLHKNDVVYNTCCFDRYYKDLKKIIEMDL